MGMEVGQMRPWHGGAMVAVAIIISQYFWSVGEGAPAQSPMDYLMILGFIGIITLSPCIAYDRSSGSSDSEE